MTSRWVLSILAVAVLLGQGCGAPEPEEKAAGPFELPPVEKAPKKIEEVPPPEPKSVVVVFDGSGSMSGKREGRTKIDIARAAFEELVAKLASDNVRAGLIAYGHRRKNDCNDIELLAPLAPVDPSALGKSIENVQPLGSTPIASALELAGEQLAEVADEKAIVLVTDGEDNCPGDPLAVAARLQEEFGIRLYVVGFDIIEPAAAIELSKLAKTGDGGYYTAATIEGLEDMIGQVAAAVETGRATVDQTVRENIHLVLDRSREMQEPYDDGQRTTTRLAVAKGALVKVLKGLAADRDNLAFRHFGGSCDADGSELVVPFGLNLGLEIGQRVDTLEALGKERTLVDGVIAAARDFTKAGIPNDVSKRVVVITGGNDRCYGKDPVARIREELKKRDIRPKYHFIGIGLHNAQAAELKQIANELGGRLDTVLTREQLEDVLVDIFETFPAIDSLRELLKVADDGAQLLNEAIKELRRQKYTSATEKVVQASDLSLTTLPFRDLARRRARGEFLQLFEIARQLRELQREAAPVVLSMAEQHRNGNQDEFSRLKDQHQAFVRQYNDVVERGRLLLKALGSS